MAQHDLHARTKLAVVLVLIVAVLVTPVARTLAQTIGPLIWSNNCEGRLESFPYYTNNVPYPYPAYEVYCYGYDDVSTPTVTSVPTSTPVAPTPTWTPVSPTAVPSPVPTPIPSNGDRFVDRRDYGAWPTGAGDGSDVKMVFLHRSVGGSISWGLDCLGAAFLTQSMCKMYVDNPFDDSNVDRPYFVSSTWQSKMKEFESFVRANTEVYDVFSFKYCYTNGINTNLLYNADARATIALFERLADEFPNKTFVIWTMPLIAKVSAPGIEAYNAGIRAYGRSTFPSNIYIFDLASIESYQEDGTICSDADGEFLCPLYHSPSATGGHLVKTGSEWVARFFWVLLAEIEQ